MQYTIGIDGGGTKTELNAVAPDGLVLAAINGGASNAFSIGFDRAWSIIRGLLERLWSEFELLPSDCMGLGVGLAGVDREEDRRRWSEALTDLLRMKKAGAAVVTVGNDAETALYGTTGKRQGIVAISGTGSIVYGLTPDGRRLRVGGWGHLLGDAGSGYAIGLRTLQAVMQMYDGQLPRTALFERALAAAGLSEAPLLKDFAYSPERTKQDFASFAKPCIETALQGEETAIRIITSEALALAEQTLALTRKDASFEAAELVLAGSIFKHSDLFRETYGNELLRSLPQLLLKPMTRGAAYGAARMAAADAGAWRS